ncbi:hypothetical protein CCUS01_02798 [Colletotrichum cuscutae]|uniref:Heterokaryon incompatibility domain-containing protein n=1 Tax=Colletotrichum cuscutae TaxID=1209917 RepID=A0AAI9YCI9_9PEZI|nr:hypothetical protein CCUS01_02798 [Colletotrichum cuscutae]
MEFESESKPVLLSALLKWCDRVKSDREVLQRCKRSLDDAGLRELEVKDGCPFCTLLDEAVSKLYGDYLSAGRSLGWVSFPRVLEAIRDDGGNPLRFCVSEHTDLTERLRPFPTLGFGNWHLSKYKSISRDTASESTLKIVKEWLLYCATDHPLCSKDGKVKLPTRLICIGRKASEVRLLKTNGATGRYACLSHPWGKRPLLRTLKKNLSQFTNEIQWSDLPPTFRDAIDFTHRLGLKYIWIDSLCIIQDDPLDWQREAAKMADIYQNAYVTLAASKAVDSSRGLYTSSLDPKHQSHQLSLMNDVDDSDLKLHAYSELLHIDSFWSYFPITKRAWVFQERLLSGRVVHFAGSELNWECRSTRTCECGEISTSTSLPEKIQFSGSLAELSGQYNWIAEGLPPSAPGNGQDENLDYSKFTPALLHSPKWTKSVKTWRQTVQSYCALNLTFSKDIFPALAGIAKVWNPEAPTWSWASLEYHNDEFIRFDSDSDCRNSGKGSWFSLGKIGSEDYSPVADILEAICVPAGIVDPTGELDSAHLLLSTFAISGTLVKWPGVLVEYGVSPVWLVVGNLWISQGDSHTRGLHLDAPIIGANSGWSIPVRIIRITDFGAKTANHPDMACLVIRSKRAATADGHIEYERLGYVRFVEQGFSQVLAISTEHSTPEPNIRDWLIRYREYIKGKHTRELGVSNLGRLKDCFEKSGREIFKIV